MYGLAREPQNAPDIWGLGIPALGETPAPREIPLERLLRYQDLSEGYGERRTFILDPPNADKKLLNLRLPWPPSAAHSPSEEDLVHCPGPVSFDEARPAYFTGQGFNAKVDSTSNVSLTPGRISFLWVKTAPNGDFAYTCSGRRDVENLRPNRGCLGRLCGSTNQWGNKDLLVQVETSETSFQIKGLMACNAGTAPVGEASNIFGVPSTCVTATGYEDAYWPARGYALWEADNRNQRS